MGGISMENLFKNIFLAGVGSMALSYEKANKLVNDLIEKGKITVEEGKELNEELKRVVKDKKSNSERKEEDILDYLKSLNLATKEDIMNLSERIDRLEEDKDN